MPFSIYNFTASPYTKDEITLGSLVPSKKTPNQDAIGSPDLVEGRDYSKKLDTNLENEITHGSNIGFDAILSQIFVGSAQRASGNLLRLVADQGNIYQLRQPKALFHQLRSQKDIQEWLSDQYDAGESSFFITGYRTLVDAAQWERKSLKYEGFVQGSAPIASGVQLGVGTQAMLRDGYTSTHGFPGERIFAIQFRKVKLNTFRRKDRPGLALGAWEYYTKHLGDIPKDDDMEWMEAEISDQDEVDGQEGVGLVKVKVED